MPETMPVDQPVRMIAMPAEQAAGFRAAARAVVERDSASFVGTGPDIRVAVPAEGAHPAVSAEPGQTVVLEGEAFRDAVYVMQPEGLVVLLPGGGTLLLSGLASETPIVIHDLPPILAGEMTTAPAVQPAAGPAPVAHGGGADFSPPIVESIGSGFAITGALAGTARDYAVSFGELSGGRPDGEALATVGPNEPGGGEPGGPGGGGQDGGGPDHGGPGKPGGDGSAGGPDHGGSDPGGNPGSGDPGDGGHGGGPAGPGPVANARPQAADDHATTPEDQPLTLKAADLLSNDSDADAGPLRIVAVDGARFGQVTLNDDGSITFTPDADFHGEAAFRYTVDDGKGGSDRAWVRVDVAPVNDAPIATDDRLTTAEDTAIRMARGFFTGDDIDVDGDALRIVSVQKAEHGTVELTRNHVVFTPDADFHGEASFTYTISDGHGGLDTATVRIQVTPVNDAPVATDDRLTTAEDTAIRMARGFFTGDDIDVDGDALRIVSVQKAEHGTVELTRNHVVFTPDADFHGEASFTYTISDGHGGLDTATVRIQVTPVNDAPVATCDNIYTSEDVPAVFSERRLSSDDRDVDGDRLKVISVQDAEHGTVTLADDGTITFTPDADFNGEARFTYTVSDGKGGFDTAGVTVHVAPVNDAPVATSDHVYTDEDTAAVFNERRLSSDDHDVDGDRLKVISVQDAEHGTVSMADDGTITFTPDADFNGEARFTYTVSDGKGGFDTAGVTVHVAPVEDAPTLEQTRFRIAENQPAGSVVGQVVAHDADLPDGGRFFYAIIGGNGDELFEIDRRTGEITTTESLDHEASDRYRLKLLVTDAGGESFQQTVVIRVTDRNEAPTAVTLSNAVVAENAAGAAIGQLAAIDPDYGDSHSFAVSDSRFRVTADGVLKLEAGIALDHEAEPSIVLQITATDAKGHGLTQDFTIDVADVDEAPMGVPDLVLTNRTDGGPIEIPDAALLRNDSDPEVGPVHIAAVTGDAPVSLDGAGNVVLDPAGSSFVGASLTYDPADAGGQSGSPVSVQVVAVEGDVIEGGDADEIILGRDGVADDLRGGAGDDWLVGRGGDDQLDGGDGKDFLDGGAGKDRLSGGRGQDDLRGGGGDDELLGLQGNDDLRGGAGKDVLDGGIGADLLDGGAGDDVLTGGGGADRFRFSNLGGTDRITDFQSGAGGDVIDLRSVLSGVGEETGAELQNWLRIEVSGGDSTISIDADGGGDFAAADARIVVEGVDLMGGAADQAAAIDSLVANGNVQAQAAA